MSLLNIDDLHTYFDTEDGTVRAVDGIDLTLEEGEIVGLVGESGSGKSVTASSIIDLVEEPGRIAAGDVRFRGESILGRRGDEMRSLRGNDISMIFQDPTEAFNPTQTVGRHLHDVLRTHREGDRHPVVRALGLDHDDSYREEVIAMLERVGISNPESRYSDYPHQFSGGMLQRAMIAMALLCDPQLVLADEPTTGLDVSIEKQILALFEDLVKDIDTAVLWITHDLSVVSKLCDRLVVMYAGKIMEVGPTDDVLTAPEHPYTQALLDSIPRYDEPEKGLYAIEGDVPDPLDRPSGCRFADRCPEAHERCHERHPPMYDSGESEVACYLVEEDR